MPSIPLPMLAAEAAGAIVVGCSGGLDSSVLLHRLAAEPAIGARGLRAVHIHHGLQPGADDWAEHCRRQALALGVAFEVARVVVDRTSGCGLEAAARDARYAALQAAMAPGDGATAPDQLTEARHRGEGANPTKRGTRHPWALAPQVSDPPPATALGAGRL